MIEQAPADVTPRQALVLWALVARGGAALQKQLTPTPAPSDRARLAEAGLLRQTRQRRGAIALELSDRGWAWARANTAAPLPLRSNAAAAVLADLLARLGTFLTATGTPLADFIRPPPISQPPAADPPRPQAPAGAAGAALPERLRAAYLAESGGAVRRRVRLAALRARLADVARAELDEALVALELSGAGGTLPFDDPAEITEADRRAALAAGGTQRHILWLDR